MNCERYKFLVNKFNIQKLFGSIINFMSAMIGDRSAMKSVVYPKIHLTVEYRFSAAFTTKNTINFACR